ncbi:MAG: hypothetical protein J6X26_03865, partial [Bacteroidales bacterium]|nr:hypothetical protein [Bacteroidales bacterium]
QDNQDNQDQNQQDNQNQQNQDNQQENNQDQQNQSEQPVEGQMSKEDAERLLNALANEDKEVQEKVNEEKAKKAVVGRSGKNW